MQQQLATMAAWLREAPVAPAAALTPLINPVIEATRAPTGTMDCTKRGNTGPIKRIPDLVSRRTPSKLSNDGEFRTGDSRSHPRRSKECPPARAATRALSDDVTG